MTLQDRYMGSLVSGRQIIIVLAVTVLHGDVGYQIGEFLDHRPLRAWILHNV